MNKFSLNGIPYIPSSETPIAGDLFIMPTGRVIQTMGEDHTETLLIMGGIMIRPEVIPVIPKQVLDIARISPYVYPGLQG